MNDFWIWWRTLPMRMDPVIFEIGGFKLQYYGLMYLVAFGMTYLLALYRIKNERRWELSPETLQGLLTTMVLGLIIGARLGYVLIYNLAYYLRHPLEIILPFSFGDGLEFTGISGMSYHGGLVGAILFAAWYVNKHNLGFREMADLLIPCIPAGYTFGRLGNFINGELWGRATQSPIGMFFPAAPDGLPRHPSQLYEAFGEGVVLFIVLWLLRERVRASGAMLGLYLIGYGLVRFLVEYVREPDAHIGFVLLSFSMGQLLCAGMILTGAALLVFFQRHPALPAGGEKKKPAGPGAAGRKKAPGS